MIKQQSIQTYIEVYFFFLSHVLPLFNECINKLQGNIKSVMVIYDVMNSLKKSLEIRIKHNFFVFQTNQLIETSINKKKLINDFFKLFEQCT